MESEIQKHLRNIRFNANKWEENITEYNSIKLKIISKQADLELIKKEINMKIAKLEEDLQVVNKEISKYSKKTRGLARLEVI